MTRVYASVDEYAVGDNFVIYTTIESWPENTVEKPPLIFCHGANGTAYKTVDSEIHPVLDILAQDFIIVSGDWGGNQFGNDLSMGLINDALDYIRLSWNASDDAPVLLGGSMGACVALNYALDNPVSAVCAVIPLIDMTSAWEDDILGLQAAINAAYGGTYDPVTEGPTNDPLMFAASLSPTIPIALMVSTNDPYLPNLTAHEFIWERPETIYRELGAVGHADTSFEAGQAEIIDFILDPAGYVGDTPPEEPSGGSLVETTDGSIVVDAGVTSMTGKLTAAGGGGGGGTSGQPGGGGGSAGVSKGTITVVPGETLTWVLPSGGAGGLQTTGAAGGSPAAATLTGSVSGPLLKANAGTGGVKNNGSTPGIPGVGGSTTGAIGPTLIAGNPGVSTTGGTAPDGGGAGGTGARPGNPGGSPGGGGGGKSGAFGGDGGPGGGSKLELTW
jgi:hypothetical protein